MTLEALKALQPGSFGTLACNQISQGLEVIFRCLKLSQICDIFGYNYLYKLYGPYLPGAKLWLLYYPKPLEDR